MGTQARKKPTKLEIANELYKFAFRVKRQKFKERFPERSADEIEALTKQYFLKLKDEAR